VPNSTANLVQVVIIQNSVSFPETTKPSLVLESGGQIFVEEATIPVVTIQGNTAATF
jgi:hypothetical protein